MSNARELALLEKWADTTEATYTPISISPTSPKATKFCCCPNRRRYNIKQPKKSTLHARNIFIDNDFTYIDDVSTNATTKSSSNSCPSEETAAAGAVGKRAAKKESVAITSQSYNKGKKNSISNHNSNKSSDYDDVVCDVASNTTNSEIEEHECRRHGKSCHKTNANNIKIKSDNGDNNNEDAGKRDDNSCSCFKESFADTLTTATETTAAQHQQNQGTTTPTSTAITTATTTKANQENKNTIESNCAVTNATQSGNDNVVAEKQETIKHQQQQQHRHHNDYEKKKSSEEENYDDDNGECCRHNRIDQQQQKIQRLSNSELNSNKQNNNNNNISNNSNSNSNNCKGTCLIYNNSNNIAQNNCHFDSSRNTIAITTTATTYNTNNNKNNNSRCNYCELHDDEYNENDDSNDNDNDNNEYDQVDGDISGNNSNNIKIDLKNKMTITTTTNVAANRKRGECGLTLTPTAMAEAAAATTTAAAAAVSAAGAGIATATISSSICPTSPTSTRPTTPSLTTVIKTTMVKRSPTNESTATTPTTPTRKTSTITTANVALVANHQKGTNPSSNHNNNNRNINQCNEDSNEPTRSVKERIAALVAGTNNEQVKTHDNSIKSKFQCNRNNMTTSTPKSAIDSLHHRQTSAEFSAAAPLNVISNKCVTAAEPPSSATLTPATATISSSPPLSYKFYADIPPRHKSGLNDVQRCSLPAPPSASIVMGSATMPRRRSPALAANERRSHACNGNINNSNHSKYGSNNTTSASSATATAAAMTGADKKFLSYAHKLQNYTTGGGVVGDNVTDATATATESNSRKLAALDNLDLALSIDLTDEDGEDPYFALQEYLERVKHEINEVFELHKARQRMQQQQEQQQQQQELEQLQQPENESVASVPRAAIAAANDELSRSIESDSGFDSASGGHIGSSSCCSSSNVSAASANGSTSNNMNNKLLARAAAATATTSASRDEKTRRVKEISCQNDINGHTPFATTQPKAVEATTAAAVITTDRTTNKQQFHVVTANDNNNDRSTEEEPTLATKTTTKLKALPPPPLSPTHSNNIDSGDDTSSTSATTTETETATAKTKTSAMKRHLQQQLSTYTNADAAAEEAATDDVNIWAKKFLRDLDNLMASDKPTTSSSASSSPTLKSSPMLLSAAATAAIQSRYGKCGSGDNHDRIEFSASSNTQNGLVLRPEKHTTIPLQSFNLDCRRIDNSNGAGAAADATTKSNIAYMRTLSAPTPYHQQQNDNKSAAVCKPSGKNNRNSLATFNATSEQQPPLQHEHHHHHNLTNFQCNVEAVATSNGQQQQQTATAPKTTTILKIEETATSAKRCTATAAGKIIAATDEEEIATTDEELLKSRRQRQLENDMETIRIALLSQSQQLAAMEACGGNSNGTTSSHFDNNKYKNMLVASTTAAAATSIPKRERINHATTAKTTSATATTTTLPSSLLLTPSSKTQTSATTTTTTSNYLQLNGNSDSTKKGSTSTIWTSEESILRSVGAVDEDNNSTSSSACEEASGVLSSGKSGISLDSSGLDNDNNESGIGTATPPKDISYWKSSSGVHNAADNESVSSLDALRKMKFQKSSSVASSDDPDLLEVLSLCDEPHGDEDVDESHDDIDVDRQQQQQQQQRQSRHHRHNHRSRQHDNNSDSNNVLERAIVERRHEHDHDNNDGEGDGDDDDNGEVDDVDVDEDDEGHDEFETTIPYCDCDYNDGDASSASGGGGGGGGGGSLCGNSNGSNANNNHVISAVTHNDTNGVVLRRKFTATPIMVPYGRAQKCRSHSLDTSSLPTTYHYHPHHQNHHCHPQQQQQHLAHTPLTRKLHHLHQRTKERGQLSLTLRQEPFQSLLSPTHFHELPSPSSASLHSGHESLGIQELTTKSNSAPLLLKQEKKRDDFAGQKLTLRYSRSQSDRYLAEIEAVEACKWLRAAGFPQYAQMYEDHQFPLDLANVAKDHTNLENDQLQSLYRRLCILNRCANMRLDQSHKAQTPQKEDSDDENFALSENWTFQPHIRRWSRIGEMGLELPPVGKLNIEKTESSSKESSPDRFDDDSYDNAGGGGLSLPLPGTGSCGGGGDSTDTTLNDSADASGVRLRRTGSERLKDGAKAFLRRVESIKSRRRKRQNREGIVISGPQALDLSHLGQRSSVRKPDAVYSTPPSPSAVSPMHTFPKSPFFGGNELKVPSQSENFLHPNRASPKRTPTTPRSMRTSPLHFFSNPMPHLKEGKSDDSSSYYSDSQESSAGGKLELARKTPSKSRRFLQRTGKVDDIGAHSDSECHQGRKLLIKDNNSNTTEVKIKKLTRGGSLNLGKDAKKRDGFRSSSFRSRSTTRKEPKPEDADNVKKAPVVRWHSFQMEERPNMIFRKCFSQKIDPSSSDHGIPFGAMSAGQLQIIRKLALVILTGHMERYCPTHRSGWNWELPKFIKKIKMPDYKDKKVFGVPLLLILQRTGQTLPIAVRAAFRWLQLNALDQIGLFRKSGVKSRIIKLKEIIEFSESTAECMDVFDTQQAYDVADMLKQYFRDLPESLLTTKMSETFAAIFQHLPADVRLDAVQCAVLLLPDENREILYALLEFLTLVAANSQFNQMTANNLAVCLAPSLFHSSISTGTASVSASPRRRGKGAGVPDAKELSEAKASHECLSFMIDNYKHIFTASKEKVARCNFGYMEESKPVPLEALGEGMQFHNWRGYLYECTSATIKEGREKTRGWFTITSQNDPYVDIAYKKVGDGHPLRLWRCITEVEGPPKEVLDYIIKHRATWDTNLLQCQTIKQLDERTEIFQYTLDGQFSTDFCVLRSWQTDLPRGACVIVETSIDHAKAKPAYGAVRGVVLASRYLIEPCGSGRSRVLHLARVDIKGKTPEWYNKSYGHICSHYLSKIRIAFKNVTDGPESKV